MSDSPRLGSHHKIGTSEPHWVRSWLPPTPIKLDRFHDRLLMPLLPVAGTVERTPKPLRFSAHARKIPCHFPDVRLGGKDSPGFPWANICYWACHHLGSCKQGAPTSRAKRLAGDPRRLSNISHTKYASSTCRSFLLNSLVGQKVQTRPWLGVPGIMREVTAYHFVTGCYSTVFSAKLAFSDGVSEPSLQSRRHCALPAVCNNHVRINAELSLSTLILISR